MQAPKLTGAGRLSSHHRPGEGSGGVGEGVKGNASGMANGRGHSAAVDNDENGDDEDGDGNGGGGRGDGGGLNEAAAHGSVLFSLTVLHHHLKRGVLSPAAMGLDGSGGGGGGARDNGDDDGVAKGAASSSSSSSPSSSSFSSSSAPLLLSPCVKAQVIAMVEPFFTVLNKCSRQSVASDAVRLLSLKCLGLLLKWGPLLAHSFMHTHARRLGKSLLKLLTWASGRGLGLGTHELVQGCFRSLTTLLHYEPKDNNDDDGNGKGNEQDASNNGFAVSTDLVPAALGEGDLDSSSSKKLLKKLKKKKKSGGGGGGPMMALNGRQMKALCSVLHAAVLDATHQSASFALVKVLVHQRVVVSEM